MPGTPGSNADLILHKLLLEDCMTIMKDTQKSPETRMFAQIIARNVSTFDPAAVEVLPEADRPMIKGKLTL